MDDSSGSIGRRYARTDEIAIPFGITVDFDSLKEPQSATLRDRDSMSQVRIPVGISNVKILVFFLMYDSLLQLDELPKVVSDLSFERTAWQSVAEKYPKFEQQDATRES